MSTVFQDLCVQKQFLCANTTEDTTSHSVKTHVTQSAPIWVESDIWFQDKEHTAAAFTSLAKGRCVAEYTLTQLLFWAHSTGLCTASLQSRSWNQHGTFLGSVIFSVHGQSLSTDISYLYCSAHPFMLSCLLPNPLTVVSTILKLSLVMSFMARISLCPLPGLLLSLPAGVQRMCLLLHSGNTGPPLIPWTSDFYITPYPPLPPPSNFGTCSPVTGPFAHSAWLTLSSLVPVSLCLSGFLILF